ncbi:hypothetical protein [Methylocella sp.]|uniref:hypothetical protein n=1 Tax=Methylocella sp. TaxID=1978226 RepID=UPI0035B0666D
MVAKKAALASNWLSATDLIQRLGRARENRDQHAKLLNTLEGQVTQRRIDVERSLADLSPNERSKIVTRAVNGHRAELRRKSADTRLALVREAGRFRDEVAAVRAHYQSPIQCLMRESLGSERRSRLLGQIANSGITELASLASFAAATRDKELGAALCTRVSMLPIHDRPFSAHELADALVGEDHRRVTQAILETERIAIETLHSDSAFETGKTNLSRTMQTAIMRREEQAVGADLTDLDAITEKKED